MTAERLVDVDIAQADHTDLRELTRLAIDEAGAEPMPGLVSPRFVVALTVSAEFGELPSVAYLCLDGTWRVQDRCRMAQVVRLPDIVGIECPEFEAQTTCGQPLTGLRIDDDTLRRPCGGHDCEGLRE